MRPTFEYLDKPIIKPQKGCPWADTMVLNPAMVKEADSNTIHMLFRATGPWPQKRMEGSIYDPYPIFLGYAKSEDQGRTWEADFTRPVLAPAVEYDVDKVYITNIYGERVPNFSNGCVEDPRIFEVEGELYCTVASRLFPPGPYWFETPGGGETYTNTPKWSKNPNNPFGLAALKNNTVSILFRLELDKLKTGDYENAFKYVCNLTDGSVDDNRDVFLFPEKMNINNKLQYVMLHRPHNPECFEAGKGVNKPSIMLAAAEDFKEFTGSKTEHTLLAKGIFEWEEERIGASFGPIKLNDEEWLLPYHGKQLPDYGYTQSFMILKNQDNDFPKVVHRCSDRLMYATQEWELPDRFPCPCIFSTGSVIIEGNLIISYGAADQYAGIAWVNINELVEYIREFDESGNHK